MADLATYDLLEDVFERLDRAVEGEVDDLSAEETIKYLADDGGGIEVLGDSFETQREKPLEIMSRTPDHDYTCGIDGSTTRDLSFNNGLIVSASVAKVGVSGKNSESELSGLSTISVVPYLGEQDIDIEEPESTLTTRVTVDQFPPVERRTKDLSSWINTLSRTHAEGKHLEWASDRIDQPTFVDGPLLPPTIFLWVLNDQAGSNKRTAMEVWPERITDILQSYINSIEEFSMSNTPLFGVQKSTTATRVLDALETKNPDLIGEMPWNNDGDLFYSALSANTAGESIISYTPWYVENTITLGQAGSVVPLQGYDGIDLKYGDADDYKRAFFFVRPPNQKTVFRVGVPKLLIGSPYSKEELRDIALSAIAEQYKEPAAIDLADDAARIPMELRGRLRQLITSQEKIGRKEQRGADNFKGDNR